MASSPLLVLSEARRQQELRRAEAANAYDGVYRLKRRRMLLLCALEFAVGLWLLALADHVYGHDAGLACFYGGILVGYIGPYWTLLMWWRKQDLS
jgi:hypothetical protein